MINITSLVMVVQRKSVNNLIRASAKNVAAQCSIIASNLQEEMESETNESESTGDTPTSENTSS
jgi:hypothetical protein